MFEFEHVPPVEPDETVARFLLSRGQYSPGKGRAKPDAFLPPPSGRLSVTRHRQATPEELWAEGRYVARVRQRRLYGRADLPVGAAAAQRLLVVASPLRRTDGPDNPNHADITQWAPGREQQRLQALQLALAASLVVLPR